MHPGRVLHYTFVPETLGEKSRLILRKCAHCIVEKEDV
jgi:hypothetical protein